MHSTHQREGFWLKKLPSYQEKLQMGYYLVMDWQHRVTEWTKRALWALRALLNGRSATCHWRTDSYQVSTEELEKYKLKLVHHHGTGPFIQSLHNGSFVIYY
ncbi:hypothetical protein NC653_011924 [Populus alba x Populus x berolinensis]|uniref:Uncharacterized protein n=1 Tax=Populus alba x Populus x berolinensis TaxID=444605 RepID=A0AAD6W8I7_9ROSI|nr:hypothetical protein NC653_011924 [Populus alba x Populus x berolinensis]